MAQVRDGAYWVHFESNVGTAGIGSLLLRSGRVNGGDGGYRYRGFVVANGGVYRGRIAVERLDAEAISIFGPALRFELEVSGIASDRSLLFSGFVRGAEHLRVRFRLVHAMKLAAE
ncbi:MAG TPA: hypothetical protein PKY73_17790 [Hyphomonas sp.]|nr:hypothetical protein [Hyphomonas sp.]